MTGSNWLPATQSFELFKNSSTLYKKHVYFLGVRQGPIGPCIGCVWPGLNFWLNRVLKVSRLCHPGLSNMVMNCPILEPLHGHVLTMLQSCLAWPFFIAVQYFGIKSGQIILCWGHVWPAITFRQPWTKTLSELSTLGLDDIPKEFLICRTIFILSKVFLMKDLVGPLFGPC